MPCVSFRGAYTALQVCGRACVVAFFQCCNSIAVSICKRRLQEFECRLYVSCQEFPWRVGSAPRGQALFFANDTCTRSLFSLLLGKCRLYLLHVVRPSIPGHLPALYWSNCLPCMPRSYLLSSTINKYGKKTRSRDTEKRRKWFMLRLR